MKTLLALILFLLATAAILRAAMQALFFDGTNIVTYNGTNAVPLCTTQYLYWASATNCAGMWMDAPLTIRFG